MAAPNMGAYATAGYVRTTRTVGTGGNWPDWASVPWSYGEDYDGQDATYTVQINVGGPGVLIENTTVDGEDTRNYGLNGLDYDNVTFRDSSAYDTTTDLFRIGTSGGNPSGGVMQRLTASGNCNRAFNTTGQNFTLTECVADEVVTSNDVANVGEGGAAGTSSGVITGNYLRTRSANVACDALQFSGDTGDWSVKFNSLIVQDTTKQALIIANTSGDFVVTDNVIERQTGTVNGALTSRAGGATFPGTTDYSRNKTISTLDAECLRDHDSADAASAGTINVTSCLLSTAGHYCVNWGSGHEYNCRQLTLYKSSNTTNDEAFNLGNATETKTTLRLQNTIIYTAHELWETVNTPTTAVAINYNCYGGGGSFRTDGTVRADLAAVQANTSYDANSIESDPLFLSLGTDFRLQPASPCARAGTKWWSTVPNDYEGYRFPLAGGDTMDIGAHVVRGAQKAGVVPAGVDIAKARDALARPA